MSSQRNTGAFIAGSVIGGLIGAAVTLWTTPKSGAELRGSGEQSARAAVDAAKASTSGDGTNESNRFSNPVLGFIEKAAAPIVGVDLGKLARDDPESMTTRPVRTSSADAKPPSAGRTVGMVELADEDLPVPPEDEDTHEDSEGSTAHAATAEDLTTPPPDYAEQVERESEPDTAQKPSDFPDLPSRDRS